MSPEEIRAWVETIGGLIFSWPMVAILLLIVFRKRLRLILDYFTDANIRKARIGPVEIERELEALADRGKHTFDNLSRLNLIMAESRLLELEITEGMFGGMFSSGQREKMLHHIETLQQIITDETEAIRQAAND